MTHAGYNFKQSDPNWFDVAWPTKAPAFENQFAPDGNAFFSVLQTRSGVRSTMPTSLGAHKSLSSSAPGWTRGRPRSAHYALGNVLYYHVPGVMTGVELQWGDRENFEDGFSTDICKVQFSFRSNSSKTF
jgi:hypothetical protein